MKFTKIFRKKDKVKKKIKRNLSLFHLSLKSILKETLLCILKILKKTIVESTKLWINSHTDKNTEKLFSIKTICARLVK